MRIHRRTVRGVSLVEVMVTVVVIAVLISLSLVVVHGARTRVETIDDLNRLRSIHNEFYLWGTDHKERFVNQGPPEHGEEFVIRIGANSGSIHGPYFVQMRYWTWVLASRSQRGERWWHPRGDEGVVMPESVIPGIPERESIRPSLFVYSPSMLTDAAYWTYPSCAYEHGVKQAFFRFVRWSESAYPAAKGLHFDSHALEESDGMSAPVGFVDGSSAAMNWSDANREGEDDCAVGLPLIATPGGILGRDFIRRSSE